MNLPKHTTDNETGISYTLHGDYYLPDLILPPEKDNRPIGMWGRMHRQYLMEHRKALFTHLAMGNELHTYLADIDEQASEMFDSIVRDMKKAEGITEELKAKDQMAWVGAMENIRSRATEIVNEELIYV